ncbi:NAD(P)/FAD-dependent oxidoreductase [Arthrobacter sp. MPF02]|uniref:NAD(P)/FAD-dependent oxidoreductase n=1 Tax=Arthrobacter sp. MPF02 TaxID=3388492 RepID=UPI00398542E5
MAGVPDALRVSRSGPRPGRRLVVIGNGMAGSRAVEEVLARGGAGQFSITMFGDEPHGNYNRRMLGRLLSGAESGAGIFLNQPAWYQENRITLHAGVTVDRIDRFTRHVFSSDGRVTPYDTLIIATGSRPYLPPLDGLHTPAGSLKPGIFTFRTLADIRGMDAHIRKGNRRAVVVAAGLSGSHAAAGPQAVAALRGRGCDVEVLHSTAAALLGKDRVGGIRLRDKPDIACDLVVLAAGVRPNVDLAVLSGLPVERGLVVGDALRVQDEDDIYALGGCAQYRGEVCESLAAVSRQAAVLAGHITGTDTGAAYLGSRNLHKRADPDACSRGRVVHVT